MLREFREFIARGNVLDLAVAVIIGGAFGTIVTSLTADIIMPVAGPVGLGAAAAAEGAGARLIWVDSDGFLTTEYGDIIITSVMKQIGPAVFDTVSESVDGNFTNEPYVGTLENEGVGLAPFHDFEDKVPAELQDMLAQYQEQIIAGDLVVESTNTP